MSSTQGERGDHGERGVAGERGMKGDHGQDGETGERGPAGVAGAAGLDAPAPLTRRTATILAVLTALVVIGTSWQVERDSCTRQAGVREATRNVALTAAAARTRDAEAAEQAGERSTAADYRDLAETTYRDARLAMPLDCGGLFPDTK
jgi:hypothetical protein